MNVSGGRPGDDGSPPDVAFEAAEREIVPGETACFPFTVPAERGNPSIHDFDVSSDNPEFNPAWARIVRSTASDALIGQYNLEIRPEGIRRSQNGTSGVHNMGLTRSAANQAGNATYGAAPQVQQAITVEPRLAVSRG